MRRDAQENRERLLSSAAQVFAERGPDAGVDEIARAAGIGMGTLYRNFPTKQALVDEIVGALREQLAEVGRDALIQPGELGLERLLVRTGEVMFTHRGCLHRLWHQTTNRTEFLDEYRAAVPQILARAQAAGAARADLTPGDVTIAIWAVRGVIDTSHAAIPDAWRRQLEIVLAGFRPDGRPLTARAPTPDDLARQIAAQASPSDPPPVHR